MSPALFNLYISVTAVSLLILIGNCSARFTKEDRNSRKVSYSFPGLRTGVVPRHYSIAESKIYRHDPTPTVPRAAEEKLKRLLRTMVRIPTF